MKKKNVKLQVTSVGFFVLGALVITIMLLLALGGGKWNVTTVEYKLYFDTSVKGLAPGAAVMFRGVNIGQVTGISLKQNPDLTHKEVSDHEASFPIEVVVEIVPSRLGYKENWLRALLHLDDGSVQSTRRLLRELVLEKNLRAQLQTFSFLTGQLYVALNIEDRVVDDEERRLVEKLIEFDILPTRLSMLDRLSRQLGKKDFAEHVESIHRLLAQIGYFVESGGSQKLLKDISRIAGNLNSLTSAMEKELPEIMREGRETLANMDKQITRLASAAELAVQDVRSTSAESRKILDNVMAIIEENRPDIRSIVTGLEAATESAQNSLAQSEELLKSLNSMTAPDSALRGQLESTLSECQESAVRLRIFLDLISRNPQVMLLGE